MKANTVTSPPFVSTPVALLNTAKRLGDAPAYFVREATAWKPTSWATYAEQVQQTARALLALGVKPGDSVCILGFNRPEWVITDLAAMTIGAVAVGIYWTSAAAEVEYIVEHSGCTVLVVENEEQWRRLADRSAMLARLLRVVLMHGTLASHPLQIEWRALLALGEPGLQATVSQRMEALRPEDIGTLIYTSGTTGPAKAVMLSNESLSWTSRLLCTSFQITQQDRLISYLPLAHIAEQMGAIHNHVHGGYQLYFAQSLDQLGEHLQEVQPTVFFGVPRVWEKMQSAIEGKLKQASGVKARLASWAMGVGKEASDRRLKEQRSGLALTMNEWLAGRLFHQKVRKALGFGSARVLISGAAPIATETLRFFTGLGMVIGEVYGQSETCGPTSMGLSGATMRLGSVGKPPPGVEVRIADDGEVMVSGNNVFMGYFKQPENSAEALGDGWLHSGDLGHFDADGYLFVTGRKKEIIITSGGKNISPANIEADLMNLPLVEHAVVCGDGRHFLSALLTLNTEALTEFAKHSGLAGTVALWRHDAKIRVEVQRGIDQVNEHHARVAHVRKFAVLDEPFTIETGELTPTMKIKRKAVLNRYADTVQRIYSDEDPAPGPRKY